MKPLVKAIFAVIIFAAAPSIARGQAVEGIVLEEIKYSGDQLEPAKQPMLIAETPYTGQQTPAARAATFRETIFHMGFGVLDFSSYNSLMTSFSLEYSRTIKGNLYWGVYLSQKFHEGDTNLTPCSTYDCTSNYAAANITLLSGMLYYHLPVIRKNLYLRAGAGFGVGYHYIKHIDRERLNDKLLPYFSLELQWVYRTPSGIEYKFSPLVLTPSRFNYSPMRVDRLGPKSWQFDFLHYSIGFVF